MTIADGEPDPEEFSENLEAFFQGEALPTRSEGLSIGRDGDEAQSRYEAQLERELDKLLKGEELAPPDRFARGLSLGAEQEDFERLYDEVIFTPYDKARQRLIEATTRRDAASPGSDAYHQAMADVAKAQLKFKTEQERAVDDDWRALRNIDRYRKGEGRDDYNDGRRTVRDEPNARTRDMTPEEREQHKRDKNAEKQWKHAKRKAGWSEERIKAELPQWWEKRRAKRACG